MTGRPSLVRPRRLPAPRFRHPRLEDPAHLEFIRTLPSLVRGEGPTEAAHIRFAAQHYGKRETGMAEKPDDCWTVPLCGEKHRWGKDAQHGMSEREFWDRRGIDVCAVAMALWMWSGDIERGLKIVHLAQLHAKPRHDLYARIDR